MMDTNELKRAFSMYGNLDWCPILEIYCHHWVERYIIFLFTAIISITAAKFVGTEFKTKN
jgi:hypothetical protein